MDLLLVFLISLGRFRLFAQAATAESQPKFSHIGHSINASASNFGNISSTHDSRTMFSSTSDHEDTVCLDEDVDIELRIIEEMLSAGYSKQLLPNKNGTDVVLEIHISDIPHISEIGSFFELDLFYSEVWDDKRLAYGERSHTPASR